MKNVTKILSAVVLCAALFASTQRTDALGGNPALWPGDEANIANFPAQVNNHSYLQLTGVGMTDDTPTYDAGAGVSLLTQVDGTTWGFNYGGDNTDWINMAWGNGTMGVVVGLESTTGADATGDESDMSVAYGNVFSFGELGVKYMTTDNGDGDAMLGVNFRRGTSAWLFDSMVVAVPDLMDDDLAFHVDLFTHMDAGGADVVFGWGAHYDATAGADATILQTATIGVEANMTDWATLRAGYNFTHELTCDAADGSCGANTSDLSWGLGFNWGGLTADVTINSGLFQDPIGTITGYGDAVTTDTVTLTYSF